MLVPIGARHIRIDLEIFLDDLDRRLGVVVHEKRPTEQRDRSRGGSADEIAAIRPRPVITGRKQEIFAAEPPIGTGRAEVDHPAEPEIVEQPKHPWRRLDHHRSLGEIDIGDEIHRVGVGGEKQRARIHQAGEDQDPLIVLHPRIPDALPRRKDRHAAEPVEEGGDATLQVELVIDLVGRRLVGHAVAELERADRGLDLIRRRERWRDGRVTLGEPRR